MSEILAKTWCMYDSWNSDCNAPVTSPRYNGVRPFVVDATKDKFKTTTIVVFSGIILYSLLDRSVRIGHQPDVWIEVLSFEKIISNFACNVNAFIHNALPVYCQYKVQL